MYKVTGRIVRWRNTLGWHHRLVEYHRTYRATPRQSSVPTLASFPEIDQKWREKWATSEGERRSSKKDKMYILPMFPYPSGTLHMGHFRVYTISDVLSRFRRMQGHDVMHPIGWDAFGLPAENAARDRGLHPGEWTQHNIQQMWRQLETMNGQWDTDREFATCDASFYKHTQRLFLLLHERGLAYQAEAMVNYDPVDKTVLANEQVDANGFSWRSGAKVEKKMLRQWFFKISEFRQQLLDDLDHLAKDGAWPERVLTMQRNWLGKSTGGRVRFRTESADQSAETSIEVFTTRPDTLLGVQYLALSATHPIVKNLAKSNEELRSILEHIPTLPEDSKMGYLLPGIRAFNPLGSEAESPEAAKVSLPVYVAPYVLGDYGGGAVMGVPGHDSRDLAFWKENCPEDSIRTVVQSASKAPVTELRQNPDISKRPEIFTDKGMLTDENGAFSGLSSEKASQKFLNILEAKGQGSVSESWRLRDWLVSRQRYWGTPIPIVHCGTCGPVAVPEDQLPIELPKGKIDWTKSNGNELFNDPAWLHTSCPKCGGEAKRETDTMDTFVDSSWYFMRFPDSHNDDAPFSAASANQNLPVDLYIGGVEHAILHLLYARFIAKFVATTDLWPGGAAPGIRGEPFKRVLTQGMVHGKTYSDPITGQFLKPDEVDLSQPALPIVVSSGARAKISFEKMSKSKYNGVDPGACVEKHGADVTRAHMLFQAPVSDVLEWDEDKISGIRRWYMKLSDLILAEDTMHYGAAAMEVLPRLMILNNLKIVENPNHKIFKKGNKLYNGQPDESLEFSDDVAAEVVSAKWKAELRYYLVADMKLWRVVQSTISSVTEAYSKTHALNTIVSDLMTLTNAIAEHRATVASHQEADKDTTVLSSMDAMQPHVVSFHAIATLVKLLAPIAPAVTEEFWLHLHRSREPADGTEMWRERSFGQSAQESIPFDQVDPVRGSVHHQPFPEVDGSYDLLAPETRTCAVQVNGKLKFAIEIPHAPDGLKSAELEKWITEEILKTTEGKEKLMGAGAGEEAGKGRSMPDIRKARKVIVVRGGKTVNFVVPK